MKLSMHTLLTQGNLQVSGQCIMNITTKQVHLSHIHYWMHCIGLNWDFQNTEDRISTQFQTTRRDNDIVLLLQSLTIVGVDSQREREHKGHKHVTDITVINANVQNLRCGLFLAICLQIQQTRFNDDYADNYTKTTHLAHLSYLISDSWNVLSAKYIIIIKITPITHTYANNLSLLSVNIDHVIYIQTYVWKFISNDWHNNRGIIKHIVGAEEDLRQTDTVQQLLFIILSSTTVAPTLIDLLQQLRYVILSSTTVALTQINQL